MQKFREFVVAGTWIHPRIQQLAEKFRARLSGLQQMLDHVRVVLSERPCVVIPSELAKPRKPIAALEAWIVI
jgi:hypothetical protein